MDPKRTIFVVLSGAPDFLDFGGVGLAPLPGHLPGSLPERFTSTDTSTDTDTDTDTNTPHTQTPILTEPQIHKPHRQITQTAATTLADSY